MEQFDINKTRYTHRDYESLKADLIAAIPSLTQEWTSQEDSDPGIVLIKLMSMFGDNLSFNIDKIALEMFLQSVTQRKNCAKILRLLGYKMHWYRSAKVLAHCKLIEEKDSSKNPNHVVLKPFSTVFKAGANTYYTVIDQGVGTGDIDIKSASRATAVKLVEGIARKVTFSASDLVNNRYYFSEKNVDDTQLWLTYGSNHQCKLVEDLYLTTDDTNASFEFNVDEYDNPYIELINYWQDIVGANTNRTSSNNFTLRYIISTGAAGNVTTNAFTSVIGVEGGKSSNLTTTNLSNDSFDTAEGMTESYNSKGRDPQSVEEAKKDAAKYVFTHDTLVSASDFEKAALRVNNVTASKLVDNEIISRDSLDASEIASRARDRFETMEDPDDSSKLLLKSYVGVLYAAYGNFEMSSNDYNTDKGDGLKYEDYDDVTDKLEELSYYPYKPSSYIQVALDDVISKTQIMNTEIDYGTTKLFPFRVSGTLHLTEPLSPVDTLLVIESIDSNLQSHYHPSSHTFGELPNFIDLVEVIQGSDQRIRYFDATASIVEYSKAVDPQRFSELFDSTSFVRYNGLSENFTLDKKFRSFRLKNLSSSEAYLENLSYAKGSEVKIGPTSFSTILVDNLDELRALVADMLLNSNLSYVS